MRVWIDLTNSPHVLVMRPVIELLRADGHEVSVTARDFAQTLRAARPLRDRAHRDRAPSRRTLGGQGVGPGVPLGGPRALGARIRGQPARDSPFPSPPIRAVRHRARPRLQRRERGRAAAADPLLDDCSTTSGRRSSTTSTVAWRRRSWSPTRSRPSAWSATARRASCAPTRASRRSTTSPTSSPTRPCSPSSGSTASERSWS